MKRLAPDEIDDLTKRLAEWQTPLAMYSLVKGDPVEDWVARAEQVRP